MLRRLADSNVKTLSDGEVTDGERKGLWLPLRRMGTSFFIFIKLVFTLLFFFMMKMAYCPFNLCSFTLWCVHVF